MIIKRATAVEGRIVSADFCDVTVLPITEFDIAIAWFVGSWSSLILCSENFTVYLQSVFEIKSVFFDTNLKGLKVGLALAIIAVPKTIRKSAYGCNVNIEVTLSKAKK